MTREQIIERLTEASKEDCLALWRIIGHAANETGTHDDPEPLDPLPITNPAEVKRKTLALVRDLLNTKKIMAGDIRDGVTVAPWLVPVEAVIKRIDREWTALGKEPSIGSEVVWLLECPKDQWPHGG